MVGLSPTCFIAKRTSKRTSTQATSFLLVYWAETVATVEITVSSVRLAIESKILEPNNCIYNVEALEERRRNSKEKRQTYQTQISRAYNKKVNLVLSRLETWYLRQQGTYTRA